MIYAVLTCALHEHAYLNSFVSHYANLGFHKIYILCDKDQPPYQPLLIPIEGGPEVIFLEMQYPDAWDSKFDRVQLNFYQRVIPTISADYILLCDMDEYLYLPQGTIGAFMRTIPAHVTRICFQWMMVDSLHPDPDNIFHQMILPGVEWHTNHHFKTMFRKSAFQRVQTTHNVLGTGGEWKVLSPGPAYYMSNKNPFLIHFHMRSLKNNFVKMFTNKYAKKSDQRQKKIFYDLLQAESTNFLQLNKFKLFYEHKLGRIPTFPLTGLNLAISPTQHTYQDDVIRAYAKTHNVSMEYLERLFADPYQTVSRIYAPSEGGGGACASDANVKITIEDVATTNDSFDHLPNPRSDSAP